VILAVLWDEHSDLKGAWKRVLFAIVDVDLREGNHYLQKGDDFGYNDLP
jgi:hypothetical protein